MIADTARRAFDVWPLSFPAHACSFLGRGTPQIPREPGPPADDRILRQLRPQAPAFIAHTDIQHPIARVPAGPKPKQCHAYPALKLSANTPRSSPRSPERVPRAKRHGKLKLTGTYPAFPPWQAGTDGCLLVSNPAFSSAAACPIRGCVHAARRPFVAVPHMRSAYRALKSREKGPFRPVPASGGSLEGSSQEVSRGSQRFSGHVIEAESNLPRASWRGLLTGVCFPTSVRPRALSSRLSLRSRPFGLRSISPPPPRPPSKRRWNQDRGLGITIHRTKFRRRRAVSLPTDASNTFATLLDGAAFTVGPFELRTTSPHCCCPSGLVAEPSSPGPITGTTTTTLFMICPRPSLPQLRSRGARAHRNTTSSIHPPPPRRASLRPPRALLGIQFTAKKAKRTRHASTGS
ncbi:hypothetical protein OF83DRAFT_1158659 [Amylostereum chailletii]|nr:hypothetical protein OF83DRAFT_1158659 [Amylostereum chailletii]